MGRERNLPTINVNRVLLSEQGGYGLERHAEIDVLSIGVWPKDRHAKRRLPSRQFLARFKNILNPQGTLEFKTDNRGLFDFAVEEVEPAGFTLLACTYDLHQDEVMNQGNIMTEYEEKFSSLGNPIYKYIIRP